MRTLIALVFVTFTGLRAAERLPPPPVGADPLYVAALADADEVSAMDAQDVLVTPETRKSTVEAVLKRLWVFLPDADWKSFQHLREYTMAVHRLSGHRYVPQYSGAGTTFMTSSTGPILERINSQWVDSVVSLTGDGRWVGRLVQMQNDFAEQKVVGWLQSGTAHLPTYKEKWQWAVEANKAGLRCAPFMKWAKAVKEAAAKE